MTALLSAPGAASRARAPCFVLLCLAASACSGGASNRPADAAPDGGTTPVELSTGLRVRAASPSGPSACKITVSGREGTPTPRWAREVGVWLDEEAFAVHGVVFASTCDVRVPLPPGDYEVAVSRGIRREIARAQVVVGRGEVSELPVSLARAPGTGGLACVDLHVHAAPSWDSPVPMDQRLVSAVAEGLDGLVASDHDAIGDWSLALAETGLEDRLLVVTGNEVTPDRWSEPTFIGHVGVFPVPLELEPARLAVPGAGMAELLGSVRTAAPDALVQINHPRWNRFIGYFDAMMWETGALSGQAEIIGSFDTLEVWNGHELILREGGSSRDRALRDWWALLNAGVPLVATGNSDSHGLAFDTVGYPRTCVPAPDGEPLRAEHLLEALRGGAAFFTSGPMLEVTVEGGAPGQLVAADGSVVVEVRAPVPAHVPVDEAVVVVDGREVERLALEGEPPSASTEIPLSADAWVVVYVEGEAPVGVVAGERAHPLRSAAFANPVYVDLDGDGLWTAPGAR